MGGSSFDFIAQGLQKQQQVMEGLAAENKKLRRQLADLRAGRGIFVEIGDMRVALNTLLEGTPPNPPSPIVAPAPQSVESEAAFPIAEAPTMEIAELPPQATPEKTAPRTPAPRQQVPSQAPSRFLEEMMIDEFSSAMTTQIVTPTGQAPKQEMTDEEEKAALRRELLGSFLLE